MKRFFFFFLKQNHQIFLYQYYKESLLETSRNENYESIRLIVAIVLYRMHINCFFNILEKRQQKTSTEKMMYTFNAEVILKLSSLMFVIPLTDESIQSAVIRYLESLFEF